MTNKPAGFSLKIPLSKQAETLVKIGEKVDQDQALVKVDRQKIKEIDLAVDLKINPKKIADFLKVGLGKSVEKGQVLAEKRNFLRKNKVVSPVSGKIETFSDETGILQIAVKGEVFTVKSPLIAKVKSLEKDFLILEFLALIFPSKQAFGESGWGNLKSFSGNIFDLKENEGEIVCVEKLALDVLRKLETLGATGVICLKIDDGVVEEADELGVLVLAENDFKAVCQLTDKRAKVDINDKRLIVAK